MHSSPGGPIAILFMMVPLIVVPLIAIFGIPNLPTNLSSAATEESAIQFDSFEDEKSADESAAHHHSEAPDFEDEITELDSESAHSKHSHQKSVGENKTSPAKAMKGWSVDPDKKNTSQGDLTRASTPSFDDDDSDIEFQLKYDDEDETQSASGASNSNRSRFAMSKRNKDHLEQVNFDDISDSAGEDGEWISDEELLNSDPLTINNGETEKSKSSSSSTKMSWPQSIQKLRSYGIKNYQLVPGSVPGEFMFRCATVSPRNSRLVFRFESEAADPLNAVSNVINQVKKWRQQQQ